MTISDPLMDSACPPITNAYLCRHGKYRFEHWCDDHADHEATTTAQTPTKRPERGTVATQGSGAGVRTSGTERGAQSPRERYEAACADLRHISKAAWVPWEDLPIDGRLSWGATE